MNKRERALAKALTAGTVRCPICNREWPSGARGVSDGYCVNRAACSRRLAVALGSFPKFVTLGDMRPVFSDNRSLSQARLGRQAAAYHAHMEQYRFNPENDLVVV